MRHCAKRELLSLFLEIFDARRDYKVQEIITYPSDLRFPLKFRGAKTFSPPIQIVRALKYLARK